MAAFAARALRGEPLVIPGNPGRTRDLVFVDDIVGPIEEIVAAALWDDVYTLAGGTPTPLRRVAELVRDAAGTTSPIETPGGRLAPGEDESYETASSPELAFEPRPLQEGIANYVDWLRGRTAQSRTRG